MKRNYFKLKCPRCTWEGERDLEIIKWHYNNVRMFFYCPACTGNIAIDKAEYVCEEESGETKILTYEPVLMTTNSIISDIIEKGIIL